MLSAWQEREATRELVAALGAAAGEGGPAGWEWLRQQRVYLEAGEEAAAPRATALGGGDDDEGDDEGEGEGEGEATEIKRSEL